MSRFGPSPITGWEARLKRLMDLAICIPALLVLSPLLLLLALAVRLDSPGPALFRQVRIGQRYRRFAMYKFRTMHASSSEGLPARATIVPNGQCHKQPDDPRVTRLGKVLRRTSLDELPQIFNVLKGDMTVVGPRPELPAIVEGYQSWQYERLVVPQGITGWWQIHGRSERVMHLHTEDDIFYVRNFSLWLDLRILARTIPAVLRGTGAF